MGIFGVDVSNHQRTFDFRGWDFAIIKSSEGNGFRDAYFAGHLANARAAGCLVAAYHYQRDVSAASQVALIKSMVPKDVPVIIDVEHGSGPISITRQIVNLLRASGYSVPLTYLPRWYWNGVSQPDLTGLPALWASWYPDYVARPKEQGIAKVPASAWNPYGGLPVAMMQFTSSPFDQNYYPGTRDQLAALLNGRAPGGGGGTGDNDMQWNDVVPVASPNDPTYVENHPYGYVEGSVFFRVADLYNHVIPALATEVKAVKDAVEDIQVGGIDYDLLATKVAMAMLAELDVDLVKRPDQS